MLFDSLFSLIWLQTKRTFFKDFFLKAMRGGGGGGEVWKGFPTIVFLMIVYRPFFYVEPSYYTGISQKTFCVYSSFLKGLTKTYPDLKYVLALKESLEKYKSWLGGYHKTIPK